MRALARALIVSILVILIAVVAFSYLSGSAWLRFPRPSSTVGTSGAFDPEKVRERGAEVGQKMAIAAAKVQESVGEAALTSKIKAKMVLDDSVKARTIDVSTHGSTVTLSGTVQSTMEHDRAFALARETAGVTQVIDQLRVQLPR